VYPVSLRDLEAFVGGAETVERAAA
jgi:hypothetical protein